MIKKATALLAPAALLALPLAAPAFAAEQDTTTYTANLGSVPLNSGGNEQVSFTIEVTGNTATVSAQASGLAETFKGNPYPHVAHIHVGGQGVCPTPESDENGDGAIASTEARSGYGPIKTTFTSEGDTSAESATDVKRAFVAGGSGEYQRTFELNEATLQGLRNGSAVIVAHGVVPSNLGEEAQGKKSNLVPELPLAATAPVVCGQTTASQMGNMPSGSVDTGGGSTSGIENAWLFGAGGLALLAAGGTLVMRRRREGEQS